jgi:sulfide dehydrogenase [flavocytochrome c] flavoprotein chain
MSGADRRAFLRRMGGGALGLLAAGCAGGGGGAASRRVVVVGGGFGGATAARAIRLLDPSIAVTLIERDRRHVCCPFSNHVLAGLRSLDDLVVGYDALAARHGVRVVNDEATAIDADDREVRTRGGGRFAYDRLIVAPGIDFDGAAVEGFDAAATPLLLPHAWKAGEQTLLLRRQIEAMPDGGTVLISVPPSPYRCPGAPYERACLIAWYLRRHKPRSKVVVLDANPEIVALPDHFRKVWKTRYDGMVEYLPGRMVPQVDGHARTLLVDGIEPFIGDVVNFIPPQRAGALARQAGLAGAGGQWCPVHADTFESKLVSGIHVIGDAALAGAMPKSGTSANGQAKVCAANVVALMNGTAVSDFSGINVCYSAVAADEAISVGAVFRSSGDEIAAFPGSFGTSPLDSSELKREARYAEGWRRNILAEMSS